MMGRLLRAGDGGFNYVETLYDAKSHGAQTYEMRSFCSSPSQSPQKVEQPQPLAQTSPSPPQLSANTGCWSIADRQERLNCYDKANGAPLEPVPPSAKDVKQPSNDGTPCATLDGRPCASTAAATNQYLGEADLENMHETYEKNQARFVRDFVGKDFRAVLRLNKVTQNLIFKSDFHVSFGADFHGVSCGIHDQEAISFITNLDKGDKVLVVGRVSDHSFGDVDLSQCKISAAN